MKKYVSFVLAVLLLCALVPFSAAAADKPRAVSGSNVTLFCKDADTVVIGGKEFPSLGGESTFTVIVEVDDSSSSHNTFFLNGKKIASMSDGTNTLEIKISDLKEKNNRLGVYIGTDSAVYNEKMVYGTINLDDITVLSVRFIGVNYDKPASVDMLFPIEGKAGCDVRGFDYKDNIRIGDGWIETTRLGGNTPEVPVACEYIFDMPDLTGTFILDTTQLADGEYDAEFKSNGKTIKTVKYRIDNTPPEIRFTANDGAVLTKRDKLEFSITDSSDYTKTVVVNGKARSSVSLRIMTEGVHTVLVTASDEFGNTSTKALVFTLCETPFGTKVNENGNTVLSVRGDAALYSAKLLKNIRMYENR